MSGGGFLGLAVAIELGLVALAFLIGWPLGIDPWGELDPTPRGIVLGVLATAPLLVVLVLCEFEPIQPLRRIRAILERAILPVLRGQSIATLALLAFAAGLGEETLFRGVIQVGLGDWLGPWAALAIASIVFGLLHAVTISYAVIAGLIGAYLGALYLLTRDLTAPIVAHGLYDLIALIYFLRTSRAITIGPSDPSPMEPSP